MSFNLARTGSLPNLMPPDAANCRLLSERAANCQFAPASCASAYFANTSGFVSVSPDLCPVKGAWNTRREAGKAP
jgi:hypothetical protein